MKKYYILLVFLLGACAAKDKLTTSEKRHISDHPLTMATLYNHYADEYRAIAYQAFNTASDRLDAIRREHPDAKNLAVVVDIDETIIDNSPHQALMIATDSIYPYMWNEWCNLATARAVPGAVEFLQHADTVGFSIFYVSNRKNKFLQKPSMANLKALGFPQVSEEHFLLRLDRSDDNPNPSDKQMRRDEISSRGFEIVLLAGDNLGDFYSDEINALARKDQVETWREEFGRKFIVLPNAIYGNWPSSIGIRDGASMDSLLLEMIKVFK